MSTLFLTITIDTLGRAIADLATKMEDLSGGTNRAELHFETLIGSDNHPDITREEQIARLSTVREELSSVKALIEDEQPSADLSEQAMLVLSSYEEATTRPKLEIEHVPYGAGIPCAQLSWAAKITRARMALILQAVHHDLEPPEESFYAYFRSYLDEVDPHLDNVEDDIWMISTTIGYLDALLENPELAWKGEIQVPRILKEFVLDPYLALARDAVRMH